MSDNKKELKVTLTRKLKQDFARQNQPKTDHGVFDNSFS